MPVFATLRALLAILPVTAIDGQHHIPSEYLEQL
jgi:hypothetical protein